jgi:uncharacterized protein (TIGR04255 family)
MLFVNKVASMMVAIGPDLLAVNILKDYPGWETYSAVIKKQFDTYVTTAKPTGFKRIGLRFINTIGFASPRVETTEYFNYYPHLPETIDQDHGPFSMQVTHPYAEQREGLMVRIGNPPVMTENVSIILDLDYFLVKSDKVELKDGLSWVERAHEKIEEMFEACITDKARAMFEEAK